MSIKSPRSFRSPSPTGVKVFSALFLLLTLLVLTLMLQNQASVQQTASELRVADQSHALAQQVDAALRETDLVLGSLNANPLVARLLSGSALNTNQQLQLQQQLHTTILRIPLLDQIQISNANCMLVFSSQSAARLSLRQTNLCQWLHSAGSREKDGFTAAIMQPGEHGLQHAIRLLDERQHVVGFALGVISEPAIQSLAADIATAPGDEILLRDIKGNLVASWPTPANAVSRMSLDDIESFASDGKQQLFSAPSPLDSQDHLYSTRTLESYPVIITAGRATSSDRQAIRNQAAIYILAWIVLAALTFLAAYLYRLQREQNLQLRQSAQRLHENQEQTHQILEAVPEAILLVEHQGMHIRYANTPARTLLDLGDTADALPDIDGARASPRFHIKPLAERLSSGQTLHRTDVEIERENQTRLWVSVTMEPLHGQGASTSLITLSDQSQRRALERSLADQAHQMEVMAHIDPLTQLVNRRSALQALSAEVSRCERYGQSLSLACFDIDRFRAFNERYGNQAGDNVLIAVANELRDNTRATDICARTAGEEFMVIFTNTPLPQAYQVMDRIRTNIARTIFPFAQDTVTFSGGVTAWRPSDRAEDLERRAGQLSRQAKQDGRNLLLSDESPV